MEKRLAGKSAIFVYAILLFAVTVNSVSAQTTWAAFWQKFKTAVVKNDRKTVLSLSKETLSEADYKQMFAARGRRNCFAKAKPVKDEQGNYSVFCGEQGYLFHKVGKQYKFIEGFAND